MCKLKLTSHTIRRIALPLCLLAAGSLGTGIALSSCKDEIQGISTPSETIVFTPEADAPWKPMTRSDLSPPGDSLPPARDTVYTLSSGEEGKIYLSVEHGDSFPAAPEGEAARTRSTGTRKNGFNSFNVYAYAFTGRWQENTVPNLMADVKVNKDSKGIWTPEGGTYFMPGYDCNVNFFGYSPADAPGLKKPEQVKGYPKFTLTVPEAADQQRDVLFGYNPSPIPSSNRTAIPMQFSHALTAVNFAYGTNKDGSVNFPPNVHITQIELSGIKQTGTARHNEHEFSGWTLGQETTTYRIDNLTADHKSSQNLTSSPLLLMPQSLTSGSKLTVHLSAPINGKNVLEHSFEGDAWRKGESVTYRITTKAVERDTVFELRIGPLAFDLKNKGALQSAESMMNSLFGPDKLQSDRFSIAAYITDRGNSDPTKFEPIEYALSYSYNGGNDKLVKEESKAEKDDYFKLGNIPDNPGEKKLYWNIPAAEFSYRSKISQRMADRQPYAENEHEARDLSLFDHEGNPYKKTTANCYLIDRAGWYKFPLVYGNSYNNGAENRRAWNQYDFYSGIGKITASEIRGAEAAELVWQDVQGLIDEVKLDPNKSYLLFHIPKERIMEGNAVVAVKKGEDIIWSWHLWLTDKKLKAVGDCSQTASNLLALSNSNASTGPQYAGEDNIILMMRTPLGSMEANKQVYLPRKLTLKIKSAQISYPEQTINLGHDGNKEEKYYRNCLYYQWGRKDPMFPNDGGVSKPGIPRTIYGPYGLQTLEFPDWTGEGTTSRLQKRCKFITSFDNSYPLKLDVRLWNPANSYRYGYYSPQGVWNDIKYGNKRNYRDDKPNFVKSVYDPSPAGFRVPMLIEYKLFYSNQASPENPNNYPVYKEDNIAMPDEDGVGGIKGVKLKNKNGNRQNCEFLITPYYGYLSRFKTYMEFGERAYFWCASQLNSASAGGAMNFNRNNGTAQFREAVDLDRGLPIYSVTEKWYNDYLKAKNYLNWQGWPTNQ